MVGDILSGAAALIDSTNSGINLGYGIYTDQRNYWHAKHVQEETWRREDSAVQRRVNDAIKAGINPYDAISSGAGNASGGIASIQSGTGLNPGSALDTVTALQNMKILKEKLKQEKAQTDIINFAKNDAYRQDFLGRLSFQYETGAEQGYGNPLSVRFNYPENDYVDDFSFFSNKPFLKRLAQGYQNFLNQSDILRKENLWFNTNEFLNAFNSGTGSIGNLFGAFGYATGGYRDIQTGNYFRNQNNFYDSYNKNRNPIGFNFSYK